MKNAYCKSKGRGRRGCEWKFGGGKSDKMIVGKVREVEGNYGKGSRGIWGK